MFSWTQEMVDFMQAAADRTEYYPKLAQLLAEKLSDASHICDAGCGIGSLSLELAKYFDRVTAADRSPEAMAALRSSIEKRKVGNIDCLTADLTAFAPEEKFDAMVFCFFGRTEQILTIAKKQCRGRFAIIKKNYSFHRFSLEKHRLSDETADDCQTILEERGIPFSREDRVFECGQPFESIGQAMRFFELYDRGDAGLRTEDAVRRQLVLTDDPEFPYYLPKKKEIGMFILNTEDLP